MIATKAKLRSTTLNDDAKSMLTDCRAISQQGKDSTSVAYSCDADKACNIGQDVAEVDTRRVYHNHKFEEDGNKGYAKADGQQNYRHN